MVQHNSWVIAIIHKERRRPRYSVAGTPAFLLPTQPCSSAEILEPRASYFVTVTMQRRCVLARVRDECLNINIFWSLTHARVVIADWKQEYDHHRPDSALGYQAPANYAAVCTHR